MTKQLPELRERLRVDPVSDFAARVFFSIFPAALHPKTLTESDALGVPGTAGKSHRHVPGTGRACTWEARTRGGI